MDFLIADLLVDWMDSCQKRHLLCSNERIFCRMQRSADTYCEHHSKHTLSPLCKYSLNSATYSKVCEFFVWSEIGKPLCFLCETIKITRWNYITTLKEKNHKILNVESYLLGMKWVNLWGKLTLIHKIWQNWSK